LGYDIKGYDKDGFNTKGLDRDGYNRNGYDVNGFDRDGFDRDGFGRDGFNLSGLDRDGYDRNGYDINGYNREGYDVNGNPRGEGQSEDHNKKISKGVKCSDDTDCQEGYVCVNSSCVPPTDTNYAKFGDRIASAERDRNKRKQDSLWNDQIGVSKRDSKTTLHKRVREIFEQIRKHKDGTDDTSTRPPPPRTPKPPKFKCKSNQDCWNHHKSNQYYCNKKNSKCIKCPDGMHGKKDGSAECCSDQPSSGTGGKKSVPGKFPIKYGGTILVTLPGCSSSQPMTVSLEDHTVGPKNLAIYKYNLVANYGFSIKYDKKKGTGSVEAKKLTPHYGYHYSDGRISIMPLGLKGNFTDSKLDGTGGYKKSGVYGNYSVKYQVSLTRQN
jgi:hypothetical protein